MEQLKQAIKQAGGIPVVAYCCSTPKHTVTREDVERWLVDGLPDTDWEGETHYAVTIAAMQNQFTASQMILESRRSSPGNRTG